MSTRDSAVALEEEAELRELRDRADRTTAEAVRTLAELTARLAAARDPSAMARRLTVRTRDVATRALREGPGKLASQPNARRAALVAIPVLAVTAAMIVAYRRGYLPPRLRRFTHWRGLAALFVPAGDGVAHPVGGGGHGTGGLERPRRARRLGVRLVQDLLRLLLLVHGLVG